MKNSIKRSAPRFISDTEVQVTKEFEKNARVFGSREYKMWREILKDCPEAKMVTKTIKRNPEKKTTKNMTYANMIIYIKCQKDHETLMEEFATTLKTSKIQKSPYHAMVAWFKEKFNVSPEVVAATAEANQAKA